MKSVRPLGRLVVPSSLLSGRTGLCGPLDSRTCYPWRATNQELTDKKWLEKVDVLALLLATLIHVTIRARTLSQMNTKRTRKE